VKEKKEIRSTTNLFWLDILVTFVIVVKCRMHEQGREAHE